MPPLSLSQLYQSYMQLRGQLERQAITYPQFVESVRQLQAQDSAGRWWTIDPQTGRYLTYTENGWVEADPTVGTPAPSPGQMAASAPQQAIQGRPQPQASPTVVPASTTPATQRRGGCLASPIITGLLSFGAAVAWFAYTSLSPSSEGLDIVTPALIAGTPLVLRVLQKPLDKIMKPLYQLLNLLPRPLLVGAAFAVPLVLGGIFTRAGGSGYQALRRSTVMSVILSYVLTRRPETRL